MPAHDVRMSGFRTRSTVEEAWNWLDEALAEIAIRVETIPIQQAHGRYLADSVLSKIDVPGFDRSAMDGYAVIADETTGASDYQPIRFCVVGQSMPGRAWEGRLQPQQAVRIMTGAPVPDGANAVVPVEYTQTEDDDVAISTAVGPCKHIGQTGEDIQSGSMVVEAGRLLRPQDVAVIASIGVPQVRVRCPPRVRVIITGNELVKPGQEKRPHQIYEANSSLLLGTIPRDGGIVESVNFVEDTEAAIEETLLDPGADVILISGGSSVGAEDFAPPLIEKHGRLPIHGIAMRPSSPTGLGRLGTALVVLLPGNPVSCLCAYDFFAGRAIRQLAGRSKAWPFRQVQVTLEKKIVSAIGRVDYCRVVVNNKTLNKTTATPLAISGASILSSTTRADGFVVVPSESEGIPEGSSFTVMLYD